jgi:hypothetical protein
MSGLRAAPTVELITMLPGEEVWSRFGHSALFVGEDGSEWVFSFGHATFARLSFAVEYLLGESRYHIERWTWERTLQVYRKRDRTVIRQRLNLAPEQARMVLTRLERAMLPENRAYVYDQLLVNCATKIRDILDAATEGALSRGAAFLPEGRGRTYRSLTLQALGGAPFFQGLIDILTGSNQERIVADYELGYLPLYLMEMVAVASNTVGGKPVPLADAPRTFYTRVGPPLGGGLYTARRLALIGGLLAMLLFWLAARQLAKRRASLPERVLDLAGAAVLGAFAFISSLCGAVFLFNQLFSRDADYGTNENFLVFCIADFLLLPIAWRLLRGRVPALRRFQTVYLEIRLLILAVLVLLKLPGLLIQDNWAFLGSVACVLLGLRLASRARGLL